MGRCPRLPQSGKHDTLGARGAGRCCSDRSGCGTQPGPHARTRQHRSADLTHGLRPPTQRHTDAPKRRFEDEVIGRSRREAARAGKPSSDSPLPRATPLRCRSAPRVEPPRKKVLTGPHSAIDTIPRRCCGLQCARPASGREQGPEIPTPCAEPGFTRCETREPEFRLLIDPGFSATPQ